MATIDVKLTKEQLILLRGAMRTIMSNNQLYLDRVEAVTEEEIARAELSRQFQEQRAEVIEVLTAAITKGE